MFQCIIQQRNGWIHAPNPEMRDVFPGKLLNNCATFICCCLYFIYDLIEKFPILTGPVWVFRMPRNGYCSIPANTLVHRHQNVHVSQKDPVCETRFRNK